MKEQKMGYNVGNIIFEFDEIEKMNMKKDCIDVQEFTYGGGGVLTLLCCYPPN